MKSLIKYQVLPIVLMLLTLACAEQRTVSGQSTDVPKKAMKYFNQGYDQFMYGEYEKAEELFLKAIRKHSRFVQAMDMLARTYQAMGKADMAIVYYRRILIVDPMNFQSNYELGEIYFNQMMLDSSHHFYKRFMDQVGTQDKYTVHAGKRLSNIAFAKEAMAHPIPIEPQNLGPYINTPMEEYSPALTIDETSMFFTKRDGSLNIRQQNEDIYFATKIKGEWSRGVPIGAPINTAENEGAFSVSADGKYIFFTSCSRAGGQGKCDIWITVKQGANWTNPQNLGKPINSKYWESQPSISSDGRFLYFISNVPGGYGGTDIYRSTFTDTGWSKPVNLGPTINTADDEQFPFIHSDGRTLYFGSEGHLGMGGADLYMSRLRPDGSWDEPRNLGYPINSIYDDWNLIVTRDGRSAYFSTDRLENGEGGMDIYGFDLPEQYRAKHVNYLKGIVLDAKTKKRLGARVELIPLDGSEITYSFAPDKSGEFLVALQPDQRYALNVRREGYLFYSDNFDMPKTEKDKPFILNIQLQPIEQGHSIVLKNVFFDTDRSVLKEESVLELTKLLNFLNENQDIRIEISGHTDNVGSDAHNLKLSQDRAEAVVQHLIAKGIGKDRLIAKGYGSSKPIADNASEDGRAKNRRTEFKIVN